MTTFIDFRYSRTLSAVWLTGEEAEEQLVQLDTAGDNYYLFSIEALDRPRQLLQFLNSDKSSSITLKLLDKHQLELADTEKTLLSTITGETDDQGQLVVCLRISPNLIGMRIGDTVCESPERLASLAEEPLTLFIENSENTCTLCGAGTGRALRWAELYYHRQDPHGPAVELIMDWHHLRAGLPLMGTLLAEQLVANGDFPLRFRSYSFKDSDADQSEFSHLFSSKVAPEISVHIAPPLYTRVNPHTINIGYFVCESADILPGIVARANQMERILVPSTFARDAYRKAGVRKTIEVLPYGIDTEFFRPSPHREKLHGGKDFNFLAVASLVDRKNIRHLVQAFLEEFRTEEDVALFLMLHPEYATSQNNVALQYEQWETRYYRHSAEVLVNTGHIKRQKLRDMYANADAYVMPSNEGYGLTHFEAMACGTPTVGLKHGGVLDFLNNDNGYLIDTASSFRSKNMDSIGYMGERFFKPNIKQLRGVLRHLSQRPAEAKQRAARARKDCEQWPKWEEVGQRFHEQIISVYDDVRQNRRTTPLRKKLDKQGLCWALCVHDDIELGKSLGQLKKITSGNSEVVCLFTRYSNPKQVLRARKLGYLFYLWDGTLDNCKSIIEKVLPRGWVGILYPDEKLSTPPNSIKDFLGRQADSVGEVLVPVDGENEIRFLRSIAAPGERKTVIFDTVVFE